MKYEKEIEEIRKHWSKGNANLIKFYSEQLGGPKTDSCFCSGAQWRAYLNDFFVWYDNNNKNK